MMLLFTDFDFSPIYKADSGDSWIFSFPKVKQCMELNQHAVHILFLTMIMHVLYPLLRISNADHYEERSHDVVRVG